MPTYSKYKSNKGISIGEDLWVQFRHIEKGREEALRIDPFMDELNNFWKSIETDCEAECCGIDAFCFWPEQILKNTKHLNYENVVADLKKLRQTILDIDSEVLVSFSLNNYFNKITFIDLLEHIVDVLESKGETDASG